MAIAGFNDVDPFYLDSVEIVDLSDGTPTCDPVADYPLSVFEAVGAFIDGRPRVCGGHDGVEVTDKCYQYMHESNQWREVKEMLTPRYKQGSSLVDSTTWFITGGYNAAHLDTTEVWQDEAFAYGPPLPQPLRDHCQLTINSSHVMVLGGHNGTVSTTSVHMLDWDSGDWLTMPDLPFTIGNDVCGLIENSQNGQEVVACSRGYKCQIFSFRSNEWREGPSMEEDILYEAAMVQLQKNFVVVGGWLSNEVDSNSVYEFDQEGCRWVTKAATLEVARRGAVGTAVPDSVVNCE